MPNIKVYHIVSRYIHNQGEEQQKTMIVQLLQLAQDEIAKRNKTVGVDQISGDEMALQEAINVIQNL